MLIAKNLKNIYKTARQRVKILVKVATKSALIRVRALRFSANNPDQNKKNKRFDNLLEFDFFALFEIA